MIFDLYYISCTYVKPMNCMILGNKQYNVKDLNFIVVRKQNYKTITGFVCQNFDRRLALFRFPSNRFTSAPVTIDVLKKLWWRCRLYTTQ